MNNKKTYYPFGLILIVLALLSGCNVQRNSISGLYETQSKSEPRNSLWYTSTQWTLDLSDSGTYRIVRAEDRKPIENKKYSPIPVKRTEYSGKYSRNKSSIVLDLNNLVSPEAKTSEKEDYSVSIILTLQENSDILVNSVDFKFPSQQDIDLRIFHFPHLFDLKGLRFIKVR
jgi:hypothetical protein